MVDDFGMDIDTRDMERAVQDMASESDRADFDIVTLNARQLLKSLVYNSPRDTGNLRAGFWAAWEALEMPGSPGTRKRKHAIEKDFRGRKLVPDGVATDDRRDRDEPSFSFSVRSHVVNVSGHKIHYPYVLNARQDFWGAGLREATIKFGKVYERLLKKHGKL